MIPVSNATSFFWSSIKATLTIFVDIDIYKPFSGSENRYILVTLGSLSH